MTQLPNSVSVSPGITGEYLFAPSQIVKREFNGFRS